MKSLCQLIKPNENLNYNEINIVVAQTTPYDSRLTIYPFTNCYPFDRSTNIAKWNEIACKIFYSEHREVVTLTPNMETPKESLNYQVVFSSDNGKFRIRASIHQKHFDNENALEAIKVTMKKVIEAVNKIIETAWMHNKMLQCFPEFNQEVTKDLALTINKNITDLEALKTDIGNIKRIYIDDKTLMQKFDELSTLVTNIKKDIDVWLPFLPAKPHLRVKRKRAGK